MPLKRPARFGMREVTVLRIEPPVEPAPIPGIRLSKELSPPRLAVRLPMLLPVALAGAGSGRVLAGRALAGRAAVGHGVATAVPPALLLAVPAAVVAAVPATAQGTAAAGTTGAAAAGSVVAATFGPFALTFGGGAVSGAFSQPRPANIATASHRQVANSWQPFFLSMQNILTEVEGSFLKSS